MLQSPQHRCYIAVKKLLRLWGFDRDRCYITTDVAPMLGLQSRKRCVIGFIPARLITSGRLIRESGTRYGAVDVPLAKLGQAANMSGTSHEIMNCIYDVTFFGRFREDFKKMLR